MGKMPAPWGLAVDYKVNERAGTCTQRDSDTQGGARCVQPGPNRTWVLKMPREMIQIAGGKSGHVLETVLGGASITGEPTLLVLSKGFL